MPACSSTRGVTGGSPSTLAGSLSLLWGLWGCGVCGAVGCSPAHPAWAVKHVSCHPCWVGTGLSPVLQLAPALWWLWGDIPVLWLHGGSRTLGDFCRHQYSTTCYTREKAAMKHFINSPKTRQSNVTLPHLFNKGCYTSLCSSNRAHSQHQDF